MANASKRTTAFLLEFILSNLNLNSCVQLMPAVLSSTGTVQMKQVSDGNEQETGGIYDELIEIILMWFNKSKYKDFILFIM